MTSTNNHSLILAATIGTMVLVGGGLTTAIWQAAAERSRQEIARQMELQQFHGALVARIETLVERSGMLTSADLCPVRFRLRMASPMGIPSTQYIRRAMLTGCQPGDVAIEGLLRSGTMDFGLIPPGVYQLDLSGPESYSLRYEFQILPGVPIDRLIRCPFLTPADFACAVEVDWPETVTAENVITVCDIERDVVTLEGWTWRPTEPGCIRVIAGAGSQALSTREIERIAEDAEEEGLHVADSVPYRYARVRSLSV